MGCCLSLRDAHEKKKGEGLEVASADALLIIRDVLAFVQGWFSASSDLRVAARARAFSSFIIPP